MPSHMSRATAPKEVRARAVALFRDHGATDVARILADEGHPGIRPATIRQWATRAGVKSERVTMTGPVIEAAKLSVEERRTALALRMLEIAEQAAAQELSLITESDLRSVVGARTRAIHDLQLLTGAATSRTESVEAEELHALIDELADRRAKHAA